MKYIENSFKQDDEKSIFPAGLQYGLMVVDKLLSLDWPDTLFISSEGFCSDRASSGNSAGILIQNDHTLRAVRITANLSCDDIRVYFGDINTIEKPLCNPSEDLKPEDWELEDIEELTSKVLFYLSVEDYSAVEMYRKHVAEKRKSPEEI